jgi:hypothetical protein
MPYTAGLTDPSFKVGLTTARGHEWQQSSKGLLEMDWKMVKTKGKRRGS